LFSKILHYLASINFQSLPLKNVKQTAEKDWHAIHDDPQLQLKSDFFLKGWYFIELKVKYHSSSVQTAKIYPTDDEEYSEETAFAIPHRHHKPTYKVIYLPKKVKSLRFDPVETKTNFTIEHFKIYRIPQIEAKRILLKRISNEHPEYNTKTTKEVNDTLIKADKKNWRKNTLKAYKETFSRSSHKDNYQQWIANTEKKQNQEIELILDN